MSKKYPEWFEIPISKWYDSPTTKMSARDSQRQKLYDAEYNISIKLKIQKRNPSFNSIEEIQKFVTKLTSSKWFTKRWDLEANYISHVIVKPLTRKSSNMIAYAHFNKIYFTPEAMNTQIVLHELAHIITPCSFKIASHGRYFVKTYLELIKHILGPEAHKIFIQEFKRWRVKYSRKHQLSPEDRKARRKRFITNVLNITN